MGGEPVKSAANAGCHVLQGRLEDFTPNLLSDMKREGLRAAISTELCLPEDFAQKLKAASLIRADSVELQVGTGQVRDRVTELVEIWSEQFRPGGATMLIQLREFSSETLDFAGDLCGRFPSLRFSLVVDGVSPPPTGDSNLDQRIEKITIVGREISEVMAARLADIMRSWRTCSRVGSTFLVVSGFAKFQGSGKGEDGVWEAVRTAWSS